MKKLRSLIATLLSLSIILSMFIFTPVVSAEIVEEEVWDGKAATAFAGGTGTKEDPYLIENGAQLAKAVIDKGLNNGVSAYYIITNDIYLNDDFANYKSWGTNAPENNWGVTYSSSAFSGYLDGGYHTIYGMYYSKGGSYAGLVAYLSGTGATICNLTIANSYINNTSGNTTALFAGRLDNGTIINCIARDSYLTNKDNKTMAGIAAWSNTSTSKITSCAAYNLTFSSSNTVGGILAQSNGGNATVSKCFSGGTYIFGNTGNISCNNSYTDISASWKNGVSNLSSTPEKMQGAGAVANMANLDSSVWKDTDTYPTLIGNGTKGEVWSGSKAAWYADGVGTKEDPFIIETGEQLYKAICDKGMYAGVGAYYLITADITLNKDYADYATWATTAPKNNWAGVYSTSSFAGYLDGGYHTIYGLYFRKDSDCSRAGLIPYLSGNNAKLSNLFVTNSYVYSNGDSTAVLAGRLDNGTISNCIVHDSMVSNGLKTVQAGIVAYANHASAKILNCGVYNMTFDGTSIVGGILGKSATSNATVRYCYSAGTFIFGDVNKIFIGAFDQGDGSRCYTNVDGTDKNGVLERLDSTTHPMTGPTAITVGMARLAEPGVWKASEGYPTFIYDNSAVKGETWAGERAYHYADGNGSEADPYIIETAAQLFNAVLSHGMSNGVAAYYKIAADIYLNEDYANYADWATTAPANNWDSAYDKGSFIGHLDGGNHTVYGMYTRGTDGKSKIGFIPHITSGGSISNLTLANSFAHINYSVSALLVGTLNQGTISKCVVRDSYLSNGNDGASETPVLGAIVGYTDSATSVISNCGVYGITFASTKEDSGWIKGGILGKSVAGSNDIGYPRVHSCYSAGVFTFANTNMIWASHNYTDAEGTKAGVNVIEASAMTGADAETGMSDLDFINIWATTDGYPVIRVASTNNLNFKVTGSYAVTVGGVEGVMFSSKIVMPAINSSYANNIVITVDGVEKIVKEAGLIISRKGLDVTDVSTVKNNPLTGYKVCYTNGGDKSQVIIKGGYIVAAAVVNGNADYIAKSYIVFEDDTVVMTEAYTAAPSTEATTIEGVSINDVRKSGDANFDGEINLKDLVAFKKLAVLGDTFTAKDVVLDIIDTDNDGDFKATDIANFRKTLLAKEYTQNPYGMNLVFEDNFNTTSLDSSKWDFTGYMRGQGVKTVTTPDVQSISAEEDGNGYLHLTSYKAEDGTYKAVKSISTGNKLTFVNGYVEIRAKVPVVQGAWPSFWLKSNTGNTDLGWSADCLYNTEVDVFEVMGGNTAISNLIKHKYDAETDTTEQKQYANSTYASLYGHTGYEIVDNDWHTYGMLWTEDAIEMYVDGVLIMSYNLNVDYDIINGDGMEGFKTQPLCITLNNYLFTPEYAASDLGAWTEDLVVGDDFTESVYDIDYVRLYQDETGILYKK